MNKNLSAFFILLLFISTNINSLKAGDRKILVERFTSSTCGPCATYNPTLETFLNNANPEKVTNISYHMNWPSPGNDPMYHINPIDNDARRNLYGVNAIPDWYFDGVLNPIPNGGQAPLQAAFEQRTNLLSPVTIVVSEIINGTTVNVKADVYCEGLRSNPTVNIYFAVIEKVVFYNGTNGESNYTYVMRKLLPTSTGVQVSLIPGKKVSYEYQYTMNPAWDPAQIKNLVFVQGFSPVEILNSATPTNNFNLVSSPGFKVIDLGQSGSADFKVKIPLVASGYNLPVSFTSEVVPANAGINVTFNGGTTISNFPDSLNVNVTSTSSVPAGEYQIIFTGSNSAGITHKTYVNYLVGKNYVSVGNHRPTLSYKVDNISYISNRAFSWDLNSNHTIEAVSPQTIGNTRYIYNNWSNGGSQSQTININATQSEYTAFYRTQYRLLGSTDPAGLPVTISGAGSYLDSASTSNVTLSAKQVTHNGKTYYFNRWEGTGSGSYTGPNPVAAITMNTFILQKAVFDTIDVGITNLNSSIPDKFALYQNYPNPFNPVTNIKFDIASASNTSVIVYDMLGKEIKSLVNEMLNAGSYQYSFDASAFPSGIYYYKIKTESFTDIRKMILLK